MPSLPAASSYLRLLLIASSIFQYLLVSPSWAGDFGEHKLIGDSAMRLALANSNNQVNQLTRSFPRTKNGDLIILTLRDGSPITYGDLCGLAGDHGANPFDLVTALQPSASGMPLTGVIAQQVDLVEEQLRLQWADIAAGGLGVNPFSPSFIQLSDEDRSHFLVSASTYRRQLEWIDQGMLSVFLESQAYADPNDTLATRTRWATLATFAIPAPAKHVVMHQLALLLMHYANKCYQFPASKEDPTVCDQYVRVALVANAFADHYLQDCFASGHHMVDRLLADPQIHDVDDTPNLFASIPGLEDKGRHDYFNRKGLSTKISKTQELKNSISDSTSSSYITLYGDGLYTAEQIDKAVVACAVSLERLSIKESPDREVSILHNFSNHTLPASAFAKALDFAPQPLIGNDYAAQNTFGRSINGSWWSVSAGTQYNGDVMHGVALRYAMGIGYEAIRAGKDDVGWHEGWIAVSPNASLDLGLENINNAQNFYAALHPLGIELQFADIVIVGATGGVLFNNITNDFGVSIASRLDAGLQLKLPSMNCGFRVMGSLLTSSGHVPKPIISLTLMVY